MTNQNNAAQPGQDPLFEAIDILTVAADELRHAHTLGDSFDDWTGEPEAKAEYDRTLRVVAALSKQRAESVQASDKRAVRIPVPFSVDTTHKNQAFVTLGFYDEALRKEFVRAVCSGGFRVPTDALASAPVAGEAIQKAKHDTCHADTERERVTALAYWLDQQTFEPGMLSIAAATLRAMLSRDAAPQASEAELKEAAAMARSFGAPDMADALEGRASEADALIDALGQCRDAFPIPDIVGSKLDFLWQEAMSDPSAVPAYIKARAALSAQPGAQKENSDEA